MSDTVQISFSFITRCVAILTVLDKDHSFLSSRTVQVTDTCSLFMTNQKTKKKKNSTRKVICTSVLSLFFFIYLPLTTIILKGVLTIATDFQIKQNDTHTQRNIPMTHPKMGSYLYLVYDLEATLHISCVYYKKS